MRPGNPSKYYKPIDLTRNWLTGPRGQQAESAWKNMGFLLFGVSRNNWRKHTGMEQSECYGRDCALKSMDRAAIFQSNLVKGSELDLKGKRR